MGKLLTGDQRKTARCLFLVSCVLLTCGLCAAQDLSLPKALTVYTSCHFPDDLLVAHIDPLAPGIAARTVQTQQGPLQIEMEAGVRVMFGYLFEDFFANVKVELLPATSYLRLKKDLQANFDYLLAHSPGSTLNSSFPASLRGFKVQGEDRGKLEGGVLGMYLLFDDKAHIVTTLYFLNLQPSQRRFQTIEDYGRLRDAFLQTYTSCIRKNQDVQR